MNMYLEVMAELAKLTPEDRYKYDLLAVCLDVHGECCGSGAGNHQADELAAKVAWLVYRQRRWTSTLLGDSRFERAVRELLESTLCEADRALCGLQLGVCPVF